MPDSFDYSNPRESTQRLPFAPLITGFLISLCLLFTLAFHLPHGETNSLWDRLARMGTVAPSDVWNGAYYVLFTCVFVHGSILHIVFNMIWLYRLGTVLESTMSPWAYILFFVTATVAASGVQIAITGEGGIGASGAVYAMFGLLWAGRGAFIEWRQVATRDNLNIFVIWGVFCIFTTYAGYMNVGNGAHFGGLLFGLAIGWLFYSPRKRWLAIIPLALVVVVTVLSVTWMPWSTPWLQWKGDSEFDRGHYRSAITWYRRSIDRVGFGPLDPIHRVMAWVSIADAAERIGQTKTADAALQNALEAIKQAPIANQAEMQQLIGREIGVDKRTLRQPASGTKR